MMDLWTRKNFGHGDEDKFDPHETLNGRSEGRPTDGEHLYDGTTMRASKPKTARQLVRSVAGRRTRGGVLIQGCRPMWSGGRRIPTHLFDSSWHSRSLCSPGCARLERTYSICQAALVWHAVMISGQQALTDVEKYGRQPVERPISEPASPDRKSSGL